MKKVLSNKIGLRVILEQCELIQHGIAIGSIKNLDTGSYFAINLVNFLTSKLIQNVIAIGSIKNLDTGSYFAINLANF